MENKKQIKRVFGDKDAPNLNESQIESLEPVIDFWTRLLINQLINRFANVKNWQIIGIIECEIKIDEDDTLDENIPYAIEKRPSGRLSPRKHEKQIIDDKDSIFTCEYMWQETGANEKDFYGTIMLPIGHNQFIKVSYSC